MKIKTKIDLFRHLDFRSVFISLSVCLKYKKKGKQHRIITPITYINFLLTIPAILNAFEDLFLLMTFVFLKCVYILFYIKSHYIIVVFQVIGKMLTFKRNRLIDH